VVESMLDLQNFETKDTVELVEKPVPSPSIKVEEVSGSYGRFSVEPLLKGYGMTLGNPLRRVLYNSLPGTAITSVKIEGVQHEYGVIPNIKEEVAEILLNFQGVRIRSEVERPGKLRLEVAGQGSVCAGDIMASSDFEVVNPDHYLATLDSDDSTLSVEINIERGIGYAEASRGGVLPIGVLPIDALYTPIRKVSYNVEEVRVGRRTDFERLVLEVWTDGAISPIESVRSSGNILVSQFFLFANTPKISDDGVEATSIALKMSPEKYNVSVEDLDLSSRTLNCLKRATIDRVGEILEMDKADLLKIRNFGEKSLKELFGRLEERDLLITEDESSEDSVVNIDESPDIEESNGEQL
jgi:DNA-directed RNA polymerase subunit alpha